MTDRAQSPDAGAEQYFDILIVCDSFRTGGPLLALIEALGKQYSIGLEALPLAADLAGKADDFQDAFIEACLQAGATRTAPGQIHCALCIVQQRAYVPAEIEKTAARVNAQRTVGLLSFASIGLDKFESYRQHFDVSRLYVVCNRFKDFLVEHRKAHPLYENMECVQVGLPFTRHNLVPDFSADWIVATPTSFSFRAEHHKHAFLNAALSLLAQIDPADKVIYKAHNSQSRDYLAPPRYAAVARRLARIPTSARMVGWLCSAPGPVGRHAGKLYTAILHEKLLRRCIPLADATDKTWLPFEAFLPGVRKGAIGGLSNTIWGTLYFGLPFYNCVDKSLRDTVVEGRAKSERLLDLNLKFFEVPFCHGELGDRSSEVTRIVTEADRQGDLIEAVIADLDTLTVGKRAGT